jgi:hypothetical protein
MTDAGIRRRPGRNPFPKKLIWCGSEGRRNLKRFRGGLVFKAHRLVYYSTPGRRIVKKKKSSEGRWSAAGGERERVGGGLGALFKNNCLAEMWSSFEEGSYLRLRDRCITQL